MATIAERANVQLSQAQAAKEKSNRIVDSGSGGTKSIVASQIQNQVMAGQGLSKVDMEVNEKGQLQTNYLSTEIVNFARSRNMQPNQVLVDLNRAETPRAYTYGANQYIPVGSTDYIKRLSVLKEQMLVAQGNAPNYEATSQQAVSYTPVQGQSTATPVFGHGDMGAMPSEPAPVYRPIEFTRLVRKPDVNVRIENIGKANLSSWSPSAPSFPADEGPSNPAGINVSISPRVIVDTPAGTKAKAYLLPPTSDSTYTPIISFAGGNTTRTPTTGGGTRTPTTTPFVSISPKVIVDVPTGMKGETYLIPSSGNKVSPIISIVNKNPLETNFIDVSVSREVVVDVTSMVGGKTVGWSGDMARELAGKGVFVKYDNTVTSPIAKLVNAGRQPTGWGESLRGGERSGGVVRLRGLTVGMPILSTFEAGERYKPIVSTASGRNEGTLNSPFDSRDISTGTQARMKSAWAAGKIETMRGWGELEDETTNAYSGIIKDLTASTSYFYDEGYVISPSDKSLPNAMTSYKTPDPYYTLSFTKPKMVEHMTGLAGEYEMRKGQYILDVEENWYKTQSPTAHRARLATAVSNSLIFQGAFGAAAKVGVTGTSIVSNALGYVAMDYSFQPIMELSAPEYKKYLGEEFGGYAAGLTAFGGSIALGAAVSHGANLFGNMINPPKPSFTGTVAGDYNIKSRQYKTGRSGKPYMEYTPTGKVTSPKELSPFKIKEYRPIELFKPSDYIVSKYGGVMNIAIPEAKLGVVYAARGTGFAGVGGKNMLSKTTIELYKVHQIAGMSRGQVLRHPIKALREWIHTPPMNLKAVVSPLKTKTISETTRKGLKTVEERVAGASYGSSGQLIFKGDTKSQMIKSIGGGDSMEIIGKHFGEYSNLGRVGKLTTESQFRHTIALGKLKPVAGLSWKDMPLKNIPTVKKPFIYGGRGKQPPVVASSVAGAERAMATVSLNVPKGLVHEIMRVVPSKTKSRAIDFRKPHVGGGVTGGIAAMESKSLAVVKVMEPTAKTTTKKWAEELSQKSKLLNEPFAGVKNIAPIHKEASKTILGKVTRASVQKKYERLAATQAVIKKADTAAKLITQEKVGLGQINRAIVQKKYGDLAATKTTVKMISDAERVIGRELAKSAFARGTLFTNTASKVVGAVLRPQESKPALRLDVIPKIKQEMRNINLLTPTTMTRQEVQSKAELRQDLTQVVVQGNFNIDNIVPTTRLRQDIQQGQIITPDIIPDKGPIIDPNRIFGGGLFQVGGGVGPSGGGRRGKGMWGNREAIIGQLPVEQDYKNMMAALMGGVQKPVTRKKIKGGGLFWRTI